MNCPIERQKSARNAVDSQIGKYNCNKSLKICQTLSLCLFLYRRIVPTCCTFVAQSGSRS